MKTYPPIFLHCFQITKDYLEMASLVAPQSADPTADAQSIRTACEGWGSDEKGLIEILGHRNAAQLRLIRESYFHQFNEDLIQRLKKELHFEFERAVCGWMLDPNDREAIIVNEALKKGEFNVVVELSCTLSSNDLFALRRAYLARFKHSLEEDVASYTTGDVRKLLVLLVSAYRNDTSETEARLAEVEAEILHKALKDEHYNHDEVLRIVTTRSKAQLVATFFRYKDAYGDSITKDLVENRDEYVVLLETSIQCINSPQDYYEGVLRDALLKRGTDKDTLTRVVLIRAERDLKDIMELYYQRNSVTLEESVKKETHGHYKAFLLALLGNENH